MPRRTSELAPYFIQLRDAERRLLGVTLLGVNWDYQAAAAQLGIGYRFLKARVAQLGGILPNTERNEPPPPIWTRKKKPHEEAP